MTDARLTVDVPAGDGWTGELAAGETLRIVDLHGNQAVDTLFFDAHDYANRYSAVDTLREQGSVYLDHRLAPAGARRRAAGDDRRRHLRPPRHGRRRLLAGVQRRPLRRAHARHACLPQHLHGAGAGLGARARQARSRRQRQLLHERADDAPTAASSSSTGSPRRASTSSCAPTATRSF